MIAGEAMLFRDEGDVVVQFHPAFNFELRETSVGMKLIPSLEPHWAVLCEYQSSLTEAIAKAIKAARPGGTVEVGGERSSSAANATPRARVPRAQLEAPMVMENDVRGLESAARTQPAQRPERARYGVVKEWGEKTFPDGKRPGKTYESFCLTLEHRGETHVLQGEGLRDAIAEAHCHIGDRVEVGRLGKTKVPAVDKQGHPKLDATGAQILWDKWLWSITKKS
ncbi:hypothetical protein [Paraburkholderia sp. RL17-337-BIB-A]|uniref:hypothetical protein n=1 Tax=Paraburkholderia sp. RL17-337-BIB-A TaxID=3031636 RepID=UPI0038BD002D